MFTYEKVRNINYNYKMFVTSGIKRKIVLCNFDNVKKIIVANLK